MYLKDDLETLTTQRIVALVVLHPGQLYPKTFDPGLNPSGPGDLSGCIFNQAFRTSLASTGGKSMEFWSGEILFDMHSVTLFQSIFDAENKFL